MGPLPFIAAGVAARYGAKKLAKYLVKRNTKKNVKVPLLKSKKVDVSDLRFKNNDPFAQDRLHLSPLRKTLPKK